MLSALTACSPKDVQPVTPINADTSVQEDFDEFCSEWFSLNVQGDTLTLHYTISSPSSYNIDDYNISPGSISSTQYEIFYNELENLKNELAQFDYEKLNSQGQLTYDVFMDYIDTELSARELYYYSTALGPVTGIPSQYPIIFAEYSFNCERDITDYLELLKQFDRLFEDILNFENEKACEGFGLSDRMLEDVINVCNTYTSDIENSFLISTFNEKTDGLSTLSDEKKEYYKELNRNIVTCDFVSAYTDLINGLRKLQGSGRNDSGLCWYEDGREYYDYLVKSRVCSSYETDELLSLIEKQINSQLMQLSSLLTIDESLINDWNSFSFNLTRPEEILEDLKIKIQADYPEIPDTSYTIKNVDKSMEEILSPAFYLTPQIDNLSDNVIYVNYGSRNISGSSLYPTLAHEGYPGHLYQTVYYLNSCGVPARTLLNFKGYTEGWATYSEYESYKMCDTENPRLCEARMLNSAIILGVYAMLDININYNYFTLEDTKNLISKYFSGVSDEAVENIFYAIIEEPANYLSYYGGYLEISLLRSEAEASLGEDFNLKEFHEFILDMGECSFTVIRKYFPEWLEKQR